MLVTLLAGIVALNSRVGTNGAVWGEDFVLSDTELIRPIKGCALWLGFLEMDHFCVGGGMLKGHSYFFLKRWRNVNVLSLLWEMVMQNHTLLSNIGI